MKLWIINQYAHTPNKPGLIRHFDLGKHLVKQGVETTIVNFSFDHYLRTSAIDDISKMENKIQQTVYGGVTYITIPTFPYRDNASFGRIKNMYSFASQAFIEMKAERHKKPDIILGSSMTLFAANAARKLARHFDVPFVFEVRALWPLTPIELGGYSKWHPFLLYLDYLGKKLAKSANLIITTAPLMKEYYKERFGLPDEKFLWITNGTDVEMFQKAQNNSQNAEEKKTFDIYYTGAHGFANGLDKILDQMHVIKERFPQVRLVLVGDGPRKNISRSEQSRKTSLLLFLIPCQRKNCQQFLQEQMH